MPTPSRTSIEEIVTAGRAIVESDGADGLTMQGVARSVGVRAPSLYKHVVSRGELMRLIIESVVDDLGRTLRDSVSGSDARSDLSALASAFRSFAHEHPRAYQLVFASMPDEWRPQPDIFWAASEPVLRTTAALAGEDKALEAARLVTAWAHGFMSMELAGAFRMEGDVESAYRFSVERLTEALAS